MLRDLYVAEVLHKHRQEELHQVTLHAWKYSKEKTNSSGLFFPRLFVRNSRSAASPAVKSTKGKVKV